MLVTITPSTKQIYRYAESALSGFETLSLDNAVDNCLLYTYDAADDTR